MALVAARLEAAAQLKADEETKPRSELADWFVANGFSNLVRCVPALEAEGYDGVDGLSLLTEEDAASLTGVRRGHVSQLIDVAKRLRSGQLQA